MFRNNIGARYAEDNTPVIRQINAANIEETDETIGFFTNIDRLNAKYYILMFVIFFKNEDFDKYLKDRNNHAFSNNETVKRYKKLYSELKKKATFNRYTNPAQLKQGELLSKQYKDICETQLAENHILATLSSMYEGETPRENTNNYDFEIEDIGFKKIAAFQKDVQLGNEGQEIVSYNTGNALKAIMDYLPEFYKDDKLVLDVLGAIKADEQNKGKVVVKDQYKEHMLNKIVAILTSEVEEKKVNDKIVEEVITCVTDGNLDTEKRSFISKVTIGGIEFKKESLVTQTNDSSGTLLSATKQPTYFKQPGSDGKMKRYYINKETNYIFETPDKNIDAVDDDDEVRIYDINSGKWYDNKNNAVCKKSAEGADSKGTIFSFYNEEKKQFFYCSPFLNKVYISDCSGNEICKNIASITAFNGELDYIINNIESGVLKDSDGSIDSACKKIGINIDYVPDVLCEKKSKLEALRCIRKYGLFNMISPIRPSKEEQSLSGKVYKKEDLEELIDPEKRNIFTKMFGKKRTNESVKGDFSKTKVNDTYGITIDGGEYDDEVVLKALKIEHFLSTTKPKNTLVLEYKNGKVVKDNKIDNFDKSTIENGVAFSITTDEQNACSYPRIILNKLKESSITHDAVETELNNPFSRKDDLSEYAYFNYENTKKVEELAEEENKKKRKKNKRNDQKEKDYADFCKQQDALAISSIANAARQLYNMKYKSFFEKILCFFGLMEDKTPVEYNNLVNTIVRNINGISFSEQQINYIQKAIDNGAAVSGEMRYNIINSATISLNNLNRGKEK